MQLTGLGDRGITGQVTGAISGGMVGLSLDVSGGAISGTSALLAQPLNRYLRKKTFETDNRSGC